MLYSINLCCVLFGFYKFEFKFTCISGWCLNINLCDNLQCFIRCVVFYVVFINLNLRAGVNVGFAAVYP